MSFATKFNRGVDFGIDTKDYKYVKLSELYTKNGVDRSYTINGAFIVNGNLEVQPVFICTELKALVNAPSHLTNIVKAMLADTEAVNDIKAGKAGFKIRTYESHAKTCYTVQFIDL